MQTQDDNRTLLPPKVLLVYDVSYPHVEGGGQRRMYEVAKRLGLQGFSVDWLCFKTWEGDSILNGPDGIRYIGMPGYRGLYRKNGSRRVAEPIEFLIAMLRSNIKWSDYKCIWSGQWPMLHLVWWLIRPNMIKHAKLIVDWWEIWGDTWFKYSKSVGFIGYWLEKFLVSRIAKKGNLVLIAPQAINAAKRMAPTGKMTLIHNGIDLSLHAPQTTATVSYDIAYLGRLKDHKRVDLLICAIDELNTKYKTRLSAVIIGDGPESSALHNLVEKLGLQDQIFFAGAISSNEEAYRLLQSARVFVNPSIKEGGGSITLLEAFASGLPVVAFECKDGIDPELVGDGVTGKLVKPISADALSESLHNLFSNPKQLQELRQGALNAAANYDWSVIALQYKKLLESIE